MGLRLRHHGVRDAEGVLHGSCLLVEHLLGLIQIRAVATSVIWGMTAERPCRDGSRGLTPVAALLGLLAVEAELEGLRLLESLLLLLGCALEGVGRGEAAYVEGGVSVRHAAQVLPRRLVEV